MKQSGSRLKSFAGCLQGEDQPHKLLGCVRDSNIIMLAFGSLFGKVGGKRWFPDTDVLGGIEKGVTQIA